MNMKRGRQEEERTLLSNHIRRSSSILVAHSLIEDSLSRCKASNAVTRTTVAITRLRNNIDEIERRTFRLSVADTGYGIRPEHVQKYFPYKISYTVTPPADQDRCLFWDGVLFITTTDYEERDIRSYSIHENGDSVTQGRTGGHKICVGERKTKAGSMFSGTEASVLLIGDTSDLEIYIRNLCRKGVFMELCVEDSSEEDSGFSQSQEERCELISDGGIELSDSLSDLDRLGIGMIQYTSKYIYNYEEASSDAHQLKQALKVGRGQSVSGTKAKNAQWKMQACFILIEKEMQEPERIERESEESVVTFETQVLCFEEFQCSPLSPAYILSAINRVEWSRFGLAIKRVDIRTCAGFSSVIIEWDGPAGQIERFDLVLHRFREPLPDQKPKWKGEMKMAKAAIEEALQDLKESSPRLLSTRQDIEVQRHIPALARCISGLITSSTSTSFQRECAEIAGLSPADEMEQFLSAKMLQIFVQQTRRDLPSAPRNMSAEEDGYERRALLPDHTQDDEEESAFPAISNFWY